VAVTVSCCVPVFCSEMEPAMEPDTVMATLLSVPNAGLNWEQFIAAAASSVI
jgi:hypothetical protein